MNKWTEKYPIILGKLYYKEDEGATARLVSADLDKDEVVLKQDTSCWSWISNIDSFCFYWRLQND